MKPKTSRLAFLAAGNKKRKLQKLHENIKKNSAALIKAANGLDVQYHKGMIDKETYLLRHNALMGTKSKKEWIKHYDSYAKECKTGIAELDKEYDSPAAWPDIYQIKPAIPYVVLAVIVVAFGFFLLKPAFIGLVAFEKVVNASDEINLVFNESGTYKWALSRPGELRSIMMSGRVGAGGSAVVSMLHDNKSYVIFNSSKLEEGGFGAITGYAIFDGPVDNESENITLEEIVIEPVIIGEGNVPENITLDIALEYKSGTVFDPEDDGRESTGGFIDFTVENTTTDQNQSHLCVMWDINNAYRECYGSALCCDFVEVERYGEEWKKPFMVYYGLEGVTLDNNVTAQVWYVDYNISLEHAYSYIYASDKMQLQANFHYRGFVFEDACVDTCVMIESGFNATDYTLQIEIDDAELEIGTIDYIVSVTEFIVNETLVQHAAEINKPVKWTKTKSYDFSQKDIAMNISINAADIEVYKKIGEKQQHVNDKDVKIKQKGQEKSLESYKIEKEIEHLRERIEKEDTLQKKERLESDLEELMLELASINDTFVVDFDYENESEIVLPEEAEGLVVEYYTPAPEMIESELSPYLKEVIVTSEEHYTDILTYTSLPSEAPAENVHLYWLVNETRIEILNVTKEDTNNNGLIDWLEWITPHLSNQTFIIEITDEVGIYNWSAGTFYNTTTDDENLTLLNDSADTYYKSGYYLSQIIDVDSPSWWHNFSWIESLPYGDGLPNNCAVETVSGGANMTGNVLLMHLDEESGTIEDTSGNDNDGIALGGVTYSANGKIDTALSFDGSSDYVDIGDDNSLDFGSDENFTLEAWIKAETTQKTYPTIISKRNNGSHEGYTFFLWSNGTLATQLNNGSGTNYNSISDDLRDNIWHHVAATGDRDGYLTFYVDGQQKGQNNISAKGNIDSNHDVFIGWDEQNPINTYFNGTIDEVAIYNRTLSADEILDHYKRGAMRLNITVRSCDNSSCAGGVWGGSRGKSELPDNMADASADNSLDMNMTGNVLLLHMGESSGIIEDSSGNDNDGILGGGFTYGAAGKLGHALSFDGENDYLNLASPESLNIIGDLTYAAWVKFSNAGNVLQNVITNGYSAKALRFSGPGHWKTADYALFHLETSGEGDRQLYSTAALAQDTWYHIAGTYNGSEMRLYIDGILNATLAASGSVTASTVNNVVGAESQWGYYFNGTIDDAAIWNRSLSANEILKIYKKATDNRFDNPGPHDINFLDRNRYFQYKAFLGTDNNAYTPYLESVNITYTSSILDIIWVNATTPIGFGLNVTIDSEINTGHYDLDTVLAGITAPGAGEINYTMSNISSSIFVFDDYTNYTNGTYDFVVYVNDTQGNTESDDSTFDMWINMTLGVKTVNASYAPNEIVNLTGV